MIKKYSDFLNEKIDFILESNVVYSDSFRKAISKIDHPISKSILDIENNDLNVQANYLDIERSKNDVITFTPDRKAQEILGDAKEIVRFIGHDGGWLKHKSSNEKLFTQLGYTYEENTEPYKPNSRDLGEVIAKVVSTQSGKTYVWVKFKSQSGEDIGQGVYNSQKLASADERLNKIWSTNRQEVKVGRAIGALLRIAKVQFVDKDIESFVNLYKATIDKLNDKFSYFQVVKGSDIHYWYGSNNYYSRSGTLGSSCMASADAEWLQIYTENPNQVSLVIFKSQDDDTKIVGRALLWNLDSGKKFLDRVYTINDSDVQLFREYAKENGWYVKSSNNSSDSGMAIGPDGITIELDLTVTLDKKSYYSYPYLDTLKYFQEGKGIISNRHASNSITLEDTNGGNDDYECETCGGSGRLECDDCSGSGEVSCGTCDGDGEVENNEGEKEECDECGGSGSVRCDECRGDGYINCYDC